MPWHVAIARQKIFRDERDYGRFLEGLETTVDKFGFEVFSFVCMPNHIHLFFRTPRAESVAGNAVPSLTGTPTGSIRVTAARGTCFKVGSRAN